MAGLGHVARSSVKELGVGAYVASVVPSAVLVVCVTSLAISRLYPWQQPLHHGRSVVSPGPSSVASQVSGISIVGAVLLTLAILVVSILLRPAQISLVQLLEGYWGRGPSSRTPTEYAIERQLRRRSRSEVRMRIRGPASRSTSFQQIGSLAASVRRIERLEQQAEDVLDSYPDDPADTLPTRLGNVLRRAETTAGERYGLSTVISYPRLYPHLSDRLDQEIGEQLNVLDSTSVFTVIFVILGITSSPFLARGDGWMLVPVVFLALAGLSYGGAVRAARVYGTFLETAYDLHRFEMRSAMRLPLPESTATERSMNRKLSRFLGDADETYPVLYVHPQSEHPKHGG